MNIVDILSHQLKMWPILQSKFQNGEPVSGKIIEQHDDKFIVDVDGVRAKLRMSQLSYAWISDPTLFIGKTFMFMISSMNEAHFAIYLSRKGYADTLKNNDITNGVITYTEANRVYVDVGFSTRCILPTSYSGDISQKYPVGKCIDVVLKEDFTKAKYTKASCSPEAVKSVSRNNAIETLKAKLSIGDVVEGKVVSVTRKTANVKITGTDLVVNIEREQLSQDKVLDARDVVYSGQIIHIVYLGEDNNQPIFSRKFLTSSLYTDDLYDLSLDELLARMNIDTNLFIGRAIQMGPRIFLSDVTSVGSEFNGESFFEGRLLQDFVTARPSIVLASNRHSQLIDGEYYQFSIALAPKATRQAQGNPFIFQTSNDASITPAWNPYKKEVERVFEKPESPDTNKIIASLLREVGSQLYSEKSRMLFELLQNADDAAPSRDLYDEVYNPLVQVCIDIQPEGIVFRHNGCAFNFDDFRSITSAANSTKGVKKKSTGYKGIGFKSVFSNSKSVFINSKGFQFWFDRANPIFDQSKFDDLYRRIRNFSSAEEERKFFAKYAETRTKYQGIEDIPWQIMPFWHDNHSSHPLIHSNTNDNVAIGLVMDESSRDEYQAAIQEVFENPRMFLFLRNTRRIQFASFNNKATQTIQKDYDLEKQVITLTHSNAAFAPEQYKIFNVSDIEISDKAFNDAGIGIKIKCEEKDGILKYSFVEQIDDHEYRKVSNIPDKIASASSTSIAIAFRLNSDGAVAPIAPANCKSSFYAYLPMTEHRFKFPFYINADFILSSSREGLQVDNKWNIFLFHKLGCEIVRALQTVANEANPKYLHLLPCPLTANDSATKDIAQAFNTSYSDAIASAKFILDENLALRSQAEIIIDRTGLAEIVGSTTFRSIMGTQRHLPWNELDTTPLNADHFEQIEGVDFMTINQRLLDDDCVAKLNRWLNADDTDAESRAKFYKWLLANSDKLNIQAIVERLQILSVGDITTSLRQLHASQEADGKTTFLLSANAFEVVDVLQQLQVPCNTINLSEHPLAEFIPFSDDTKIFEYLNDIDLSGLDYGVRLRLFRSLEKWNGIGEARLKSIRLFRSVNGNPVAFNEAYIIPPRLLNAVLPKWYNDCVLSPDELCTDLNKYLPNDMKSCFETAFAKWLSSGCTVPIDEFYAFFAEDKVWDSSNTARVIEQYGPSNDILSIVESSDATRKELFLSKIESFALKSTLEYGVDSYEYRVLKLAVSSGHSKLLRDKTTIDGVALNQYAVSDTVTYRHGDKEYKLPLGLILPGASQENALGKIKQMFDAIDSVDTFFIQEEKSIGSIFAEFTSHICTTPGIVNWAQVAFVALEKITHCRNWNYYLNRLTLPADESIINILTPLADQGMADLLKEFVQIMYGSLSIIKGKYFDSYDYTLPDERVPAFIEGWLRSDGKWEQRSQFLLSLYAHNSTSDEITRRKCFLGASTNAKWDIREAAVTSFCNWLVKTQPLPIRTDGQKAIIKTLTEKAPKTIIKELDLSALGQAKEYDDDCYVKWRQSSAVSIYIVDGCIPYVYKFNGVVLYGFSDGNIAYDPTGKTIYVNADSDIETEMMKMVNQSGVPFYANNYHELFTVNRSVLKRERDEIVRLKEELERLKAQSDNPTAKFIKQGDINVNDQIELNREARRRAKEFLLSKGYDCAAWNIDDPSSDGVNHTSKDGEAIAFTVASCRSGYVYLHTYKFAVLMENPNNLLLVDDGRIIQSLTFEEAFQANTNVNLIFDMDYIEPSSMAKIANMMQGYPNTRFVFEKPGYSPSDEFHSFGLSEKHEGAVPVIESMDELL